MLSFECRVHELGILGFWVWGVVVAESVIQRKSFEFALKMIELYQKLEKQKEFVLSKQLLRSGTSIGANVEEATAAQSRRDFLSKMSIASKEARETKYWLKLLQESELTNLDLTSEINQADEIIRILTAIVKTTKITS
ncbi:MAG: four helix bundle protein [Thainema sp.]